MNDGPSIPPHGTGGSLRLAAAVAGCLRRRASGEDLADEALIAWHPELAPELADELRNARLVAAINRDRPCEVALTETHRGSPNA